MLQRSTQNVALIFVVVAPLMLAACSKKEDVPPPSAATPADAPVAASPPAVKKEGVEEFMVGDLAAMALSDGSLELPNDNKVFGVGLTPEEVAGVLSAAGQPTDKLQLTIHPLLVKAADRVLLFDAGAGSVFGPGAGQLSTSLAAAGVDPASVTDIFISHAHGDHVGGLVNAQGALAFPNAAIHLSKPEWTYMSEGRAELAALVTAITPKVDAFTPGAAIVPGVVKAVEIKGHTPGHSGYMITSGQNSLLYVGDSMHHFVVSVQKPEWTCGFDGDAKTAAASRAALLSQLAADGQRIYAVHFPFPGLGKIEKKGDALAWAAE
jgi:glyoxylase-like metal-dependent hydrolase (beta-lactamase superfamily II)